jgi:hypothetical protein
MKKSKKELSLEDDFPSSFVDTKQVAREVKRLIEVRFAISEMERAITSMINAFTLSTTEEDKKKYTSAIEKARKVLDILNR